MKTPTGDSPMCKVLENRLDRYADQARNRELEAWSAELDRKNRESVLLAAAKAALQAGLYQCPGCLDDSCDHCQLCRAVEPDSLDLAELETEASSEAPF
jgi:hypothetical protein